MSNTACKPQSSSVLTTDVPQLHTMVNELQSQVDYLKEQLQLAIRGQFGSKADVVNLDQMPLFEGEDTELVTMDSARDAGKSSSSSTKEKGTQTLRILKELPTVREDIELPEDQRHCECCGHELRDIGSDVQVQIEYQPATLTRKAIHRHKYACKHCKGGIERVPPKAVPIPKSWASASLLAYLIVSKYADHLPLYRIDKRLERLGLVLPRKTQGDWLLKSGELLSSLVKIMMADVLKRGHVYTDDTILPLQNDDPSRKRTLQSRIWVYRTDDQHGPPIVTYDFSRSRSKEAPANMLGSFRGYLQADAYTGYDHLYLNGDIKEVACWAHTRRKFVEAASLTKTPTRAHSAVQRINALYRLERQWKALSEEERKQQRKDKSQPLLDELHEWLENQANAVLPKSALGKAFSYTLKNWDALYRYSTTGHLNIDNNWAEQSMRPIALGRKNYLFVGSETAGHNAAILYSLVETCKANKINPLSYLTYVLEELPNLGRHPQLETLAALLPYTAANSERFKLGS